jgi:cyclic pyranopterin phosphate synthase
LFTCLFATAGTDLKGPLRDGINDNELLQIIGRVWGAREDRYSEVRAEQGGSDKKVEMYYIGG